MTALPLREDDLTEQALMDAGTDAVFQAMDAVDAINRPASDFLLPPFHPLATMLGGIPKGTLGYVGAFSGDGKTTFLVSLCNAWMAQGRKIYYVPTETPPANIRTMFACAALGHVAGDLLSGAWRGIPGGDRMRDEVAEAMRAAAHVSRHDRTLFVAKSSSVTDSKLRIAAQQAADVGADVFIVDHIDHVETSVRDLYASSVAANSALLRIAHDFDLRVIAASQFNLEAVKGSRVTRYLAPRDSYLFMGVKKRQLCDYMLGIYRPLKLHGLDPTIVKRYNLSDPAILASQILEPNTMAVSLMKHRNYGGREGNRIYLPMVNGAVVDDTMFNASIQHGIRTTHGL